MRKGERRMRKTLMITTEMMTVMIITVKLLRKRSRRGK